MAEQREWRRQFYPAGRNDEPGGSASEMTLRRRPKPLSNSEYGDGEIEMTFWDATGDNALIYITPQAALLIIKDMLEIVAQCRDYPAETSED